MESARDEARKNAFLKSKEAAELRELLPITVAVLREMATTSPELLASAVDAQSRELAHDIGATEEKARALLQKTVEKAYEEAKNDETLAVFERVLDAFETKDKRAA